MSQETVEVTERLRFDEAALSKYLKGRIPGLGEIIVRKFGYGQSNPTYFLQSSSGQKYVLRKQPPGKIIKGAHAVDREYRVINALSRAGFNVPKTFAFCEDPSVIGTPFYVMGFVQGRIAQNNMSTVPVPQRRQYLKSMCEVLAKLHSYSPESLGLMDGKPFGKKGGFYDRQMATMRRTSDAQVAGSEGKVPAMRNFAALLTLFTEGMPTDASAVIHGDWKPDNLIMSEGDAPEVLAVVDWEMSTIGHPMSDLANMCLPYHMPAYLSEVYQSFDMSEQSGIPSEADVHRYYCDAAGIPFPIPDWNFYIAFAFLRLSVIVQGIAMRAAKGTASSSGATSDKLDRIVMAADLLCDCGYNIMTRVNSKL